MIDFSRFDVTGTCLYGLEFRALGFRVLGALKFKVWGFRV